MCWQELNPEGRGGGGKEGGAHYNGNGPQIKEREREGEAAQVLYDTWDICTVNMWLPLDIVATEILLQKLLRLHRNIQPNLLNV